MTITNEHSPNSKNPSERYLAKLCQRAFLSLWSYPNLYTDEGKRSPSADGKELCDLCVVFGNDVILFSDKEAAFGQHDDLLVNWSRWYRRAIAKSARQLYGAENWIRQHPNRIFVDKICTQTFPLPIPKPDAVKLHLVAVTRGSYEACHAYYGGESIGSLRIRSDIIGSDHEKIPFTIGTIEKNKSFIHIFDEFTLEVVLRELDTVSDFLSYLSARESFLCQPKKIVMAAGEEQIVAKYLSTIDANGHNSIFEEGSIPEEVDCITLTEGFWEDLVGSTAYDERKKYFQESYFWDHLIERFIKLADPKHIGIDLVLHEQTMENLALRIMAAEPRWMRLELVRQLHGLFAKADPKRRVSRVFSVKQREDTAYVFIVYPNPHQLPYQEYREERTSCLLAYCMSAKLVMPNAIQVVGVAVDYPSSKGSSEDLAYVDLSAWDSERESEAKTICDEFEILQPTTLTRHTSKGNKWGFPPNLEPEKVKRKQHKPKKHGKTFGKLKKRRGSS